MLVGSKEWLDLQKQNKRTIIAGESAHNIEDDDTVWIAGNFVEVIDSKKLMQYIPNIEHSQVLHFIKQNISEIEQFYKSNPDKKPVDYYAKFDYGFVVLDLKTAGLVAKHYTGKLPEWDFIEKQD